MFFGGFLYFLYFILFYFFGWLVLMLVFISIAWGEINWKNIYSIYIFVHQMVSFDTYSKFQIHKFFDTNFSLDAPKISGFSTGSTRICSSVA